MRNECRLGPGRSWAELRLVRNNTADKSNSYLVLFFNFFFNFVVLVALLTPSPTPHFFGHEDP